MCKAKPNDTRYLLLHVHHPMCRASRLLQNISIMSSAKIVEAPSVAPASYRTTPPPHHADNCFKSPWASAAADIPAPTGERGFVAMIKAGFTKKKQAELPGSAEIPEVQNATFRPGHEAASDEIVYTWLGHAANHLQLPTDGGKRFVVLTDPVFSNRCSPFSFVGPSRLTRCPTSVNKIAEEDVWPDVLLLSHNHYDHTDLPTLSAFLKHADPDQGRPVPHVFCTLGTKSWFTSVGFPQGGITELDWWEARVLQRSDGAHVRFTAVPAQHFSARGLLDRNQTLWAGFTIEVLQKDKQGAKVYFAGDTAYRTIPFEATEEDIAQLPVCPAFKEIGATLGPFDFSMIPIGAYGPRWLFSPVHIGPWEAVAIHKEVRSQKTMGIHWGTWKLTSEPPSEPKVVLEQEAQKAGLSPDEFTTCGIGQTIAVQIGQTH